MSIEREDLKFDVYEGDKIIIHVEYRKEKDEAVVNLSTKSSSFNFSYEEENTWEDIEYFLLGRIVNCESQDPIEYLKKTKGKLWNNPISIKFY